MSGQVRGGGEMLVGLSVASLLTQEYWRRSSKGILRSEHREKDVSSIGRVCDSERRTVKRAFQRSG